MGEKRAVCYRENWGCASPTICPYYLRNAWNGRRGCSLGGGAARGFRGRNVLVAERECPACNNDFEMPEIVEV